ERHGRLDADVRRSAAVLPEAASYAPEAGRLGPRPRRAALPDSDAGRIVRVRLRAADGQARIRAGRRRSARAAADDAVSRSEEDSLAWVYRIRRSRHAVDDEPLAGVRQRRCAGGKTLASGAFRDSDDDEHDQ